ncbi:MAG TPA: S8 family serine peptidase [Sphingomicrobium sp.]|nr:S8 family serine peptidase [Sphingomicrobium sp.]
MSKFTRHIAAAAIALLFASSAAAQLLPSLSLPPISAPVQLPNAPVVGPVVQDLLGQPQVQQAISPTLHSVRGLPQTIAQSGAPTLLELRRLRLQQLIRENRALLEKGDDGEPVRRGVIIALNPDMLSLQLVARAGFRIIADETEPQLGIRVVQLAVPRGKSAGSALKLARRVAPRLNVDFDHIFEPAGGSLAPLPAALAASSGAASGRVIGMIDGGVASHPSLSAARIEQNGFSGSPQPTGHGTAVASLLVGSQGPFRGAATGAQLFVADVYGGNRAAGSATAIIRALGWLLKHRPDVINVSLVGPQNKAVERAVRIVRARGIHIVAAVGNDGPAAPPQYPASYPGVIAVTGVDAHGRALPEAGRTPNLDFAAPGSDMAAALPGQGYASVRGTSFAAPLAAARLAAAGSPARLAAEARPGKGRVGRGIVCGGCRVEPRAVGAR